MGEPPPRILADVLAAWSPEPALAAPLSWLGCLYGLGLVRAWSRAGVGQGVPVGRAVAGLAGMVALAAALLSPLEALSGVLFSAHMAQHLLLALVAAPLLAAGAPGLTVLWAFPVAWRRRAARAWLRSGGPRAWRGVTHPFAAAGLFALVLWTWHVPALYQAAATFDLLHTVEHASMVGSAALFWWSVLTPLGGRRVPHVALALLLFGVAAQGAALGALITLAPDPSYPLYAAQARAFGISALRDQQLGGLALWMPPGGLYLALAVWALQRGLRDLDLDAPAPRGPRSDAAESRCEGDGPNVARRSACVLPAVASAGAASAQVLQPAGPAAERVADLWWWMLALAAFVFVLVVALLFVAIYRRRDPDRARPPLGHATFVVLGGVALPLAILVPLLVYTLTVTQELTHIEDEALTVEVTGHQWWWEVHYPDLGVTTANELHLPAGTPVRLRLTSDDVIHSFWVPSLTGKMDLVPGNVSTLKIEASEPGVHYGQCAEFCGVQHANMQFLAVAQPPETFEAWAARQQRPAAAPDEPRRQRGREVFLEAPCADCHTIRGTPADGDVGPDLTHLASRQTLGAGMLANNRGNLGGWIVNSQALKPGNEMPPMTLPPDDLQALLTYLEGLE